MKLFNFFCAALISASVAASASATPLKVMSLNVRYDNPGDGDNGWSNRRDRVAQAILTSKADIVGTQEVLAHQFDDLKAALPQYDVVGVGREDGKRQGEYAALWFNRDRFDCVDKGNFWLSATPDVAGSMGWDGACVRIASWALLRDKLSGDSLVALNTHLDHVGTLARKYGVELIKERLAKLSGGKMLCVATGDFNSGPQSAPVQYITDPQSAGYLVDSRTVAKRIEGPQWTFHDFGRQPVAEREIIDYVFVTPGVEVVSYEVVDNSADAPMTFSDHCPVIVTLNY